MQSESIQASEQDPVAREAWYRNPWPWLIICLPLSAVLASLATLWIALSHPDHLVIEADEYQRVKRELRNFEPVSAEPEHVETES